MSDVKPKEAAEISVSAEEKLAPEAPKVREVWDDYPHPSRSKKRGYEKGAHNRMLARPSPQEVREHRYEAVGEQTESGGAPSEEDYAAIEARLGLVFNDRSLLGRALTHRSALGLKERADYERLEFLGDAVLDLSVAHLLSDLHPEAREGELSKMRAALVNTQALAVVARQLNLGPFIRLGRGELASGGAQRPSILADVIEAVIGAVYRDRSYEEALKMIERIFGSALKEVTPFDPKTELQEALHAAGCEPPHYMLEMVEGPEHAPTFVTVVMVDGEVGGRGRGPTKKAAQQQAAAQALAKMSFNAPKLDLVEGQTVFIEEALLSGRKEEEGT